MESWKRRAERAEAIASLCTKWNIKSAKLESENKIMREALKDIGDNYDCECVKADRIRGAHKCQSCIAKEALKMVEK